MPNGNTIVCNWSAQDAGDKKGIHIFEVTPDKRVVWRFGGPRNGQVAQCQLLDTNFKPLADGIIR